MSKHPIRYSDLTESLRRKIAAVTKSRNAGVRRISPEEAEQVRTLDNWQHGYFKTPAQAQIVMSTRSSGKSVLFRV